ncbi:MAG: AI-2E family transporter [Sphaerochaetaceae bacterium]|jgi:predicted PurR-regulated permease PerM|nr:AI-2E family transporter [Sphaerochaetaceae bacterium]NLO60247.1 AI-2E family transporter [Spirochaetales bacterium]MDD2405626.1 AI-2E family transporter [Sphaerochaetaceae bacterium]MDD3670397.1 AI-2E family transporter [Sphaerochaetaceae bacterium]MDD4259974.1 AI-2E family transporter [Sphaerochaetaceae bacterium]
MSELTQKSRDAGKTALIIIAVILVSAAMKIAGSVTLPLAISLFCFLLFNPLLNKMEKVKIPRWMGIVIVMLLLLVILLLAGWFFFFSVDLLVKRLPMYIRRFSIIDLWLADLLNLESGTSFLSYMNFDWPGLIVSSLSQVSSKAINIISKAFLVYIFVLFLVLERQSLIPKLKVAMPSRKGMRLAVLFERVNRQISKYLLLKALISVGTGVLFYLAGLATGLDFALMWGVLAFVFNFIPSIGSIVITALTIIMAILQFFPNWPNILYVAVLMTSIQMVLGNILDPRIQGVQLNLSPFIILVSLSFWGFIWGIAGMFLAVPLTSIIQILCANVKGLQNVAVMLGSGKAYRIQYKEERRKQQQRVAERRKMREERRIKRNNSHNGKNDTPQEP